LPFERGLLMSDQSQSPVFFIGNMFSV
jgi:hypothetical protein